MTEGTRASFLTLKIKDAIDKIEKNRFLLPAIQREFVWKPDQIIRLFDSLMKGYPIGSFLFWRVEKKNNGGIKDYQFYEFIKEYTTKKITHNPKASVVGKESITSILDGQQRLTALYIGLKGTYSFKVPYKRKNAYPSRKLFLNLLSESKNPDLKFDFRFLTDQEASKSDGKTFWFQVGKILDFKELYDISDYVRDCGLLDRDKAKYAHKTLHTLFKTIRDDGTINYYLEESEDLDKVLNIFIRVNSGGTLLSYSDLLLSIATAQWEHKDAREEISGFVDEINGLGEGFAFTKDFVLKSCLVLSDISDIAFKVSNFKKENMDLIEEKWEDIQESIRLSVELISKFGYNHSTLTSNNAIIPIAYYILKKENPHNFSELNPYYDDRKQIKKWLHAALLKRSFSGQPDSVLRPIRSIIVANHNKFPLTKIVDRFKGRTKSFIFTDDDIDNLLASKYGKAHTFSVLATLYPTLKFQDRIHIDHIHPRSFRKIKQLRSRRIPEEDHAYYKSRIDYLSNLQLLEGTRNEEKSNKDFETWIGEKFPEEPDRVAYMKANYIPSNIDLSFDNFREFYNERKKLLRKKLMDTLLIST
ncbi:MAG: GmrSD restriction endonuclease domain-containing protein [Candidatus Hodarchaeales archaeon]